MGIVEVCGGVDTHADTHVAAAVDQNGGLWRWIVLTGRNVAKKESRTPPMRRLRLEPLSLGRRR